MEVIEKDKVHYVFESVEEALENFDWEKWADDYCPVGLHKVAEVAENRLIARVKELTICKVGASTFGIGEVRPAIVGISA